MDKFMRYQINVIYLLSKQNWFIFEIMDNFALEKRITAKIAQNSDAIITSLLHEAQSK